jgi:hypothetical protein
MAKEKEKEIEILEYKIADLDRKILEFEAHGISDIKTNKLREKKAKHDSDLKKIKK